MGISEVIALALLILAGWAKGKMDWVMFRSDYNKDREWLNKWKVHKYMIDGLTPIKAGKAPWYYFGLHRPVFLEKFPFSSTLLVFMTDRWHLWQFIALRCFYLALSVLAFSWWPMVLISAFAACPILFGAGFYISFERKK